MIIDATVRTPDVGADRPSMLKWIFSTNSTLDRARKLGIGVLVVAAVSKDALENMTWSAAAQAVVCFVLAIALALSASVFAPQPGTPRNKLRPLTITLAVAYAFMALLYLMDVTRLVALPSGYDAVTDVLGTVLFVAAWYSIVAIESDPQAKQADQSLSRLDVLAGCFLLGRPSLRCKPGKGCHSRVHVRPPLAEFLQWGGLLESLWCDAP